MMKLRPLAGGALLLLAACGGAKDDPGATSPSDEQALNDAAAVLDANSVDVNAVAIDGENEAQPQ